MMADRVSLSGPLRNCVRAPRWRNALDSRPSIGHPACGLEVSDFDTPKASFVFKGLSFGTDFSIVRRRYQKRHSRSLPLVDASTKTEEEAHETS
jgi:hypothetical protein